MNKKSFLSVGSMVIVMMVFIGMISVNATPEEGDEITLYDVRNWAVAYNVEMDRLFEDLEDARVGLVDAEDAIGSSFDTDLERKKSYDYDIVEAQLTIDESIWAIESTSTLLDLEAVEVYYDLQFTLEEMGLQSLVINDARLALDEVNQKFDLGLETSLSVDAASVVLLSAETEMTRLSYVYDAYILDLNQIINRGLTDGYIIEEVDVLETEMPYALTSEAIIEAIGLNMDLSFMYVDLELLELLEEIYEDLNDDDDYKDELTSTRLSIEAQEMAIEDEILGIEVEIRTAYNDLLTSADHMTISGLNLESDEINLEMAQEQLELGQVTEAYVSELVGNVQETSLDLEREKLDHYLAIKSYELLLEGY